MLKYVVVCLCRGCDGCCVSVCIVTCGAVGARVWGVRVFRYADVVCLHPVAVLNAALCMTFSLLRLVEDAKGEHMEELVS